MDSLTVLETLPRDYQVSYVPLLYNQPTFLMANNSLPQLHFYLVDDKKKAAIAHIAFCREESEVLSPFRAPFGGVEHGEELDSTAALFFIQEVSRRLLAQSVRFVRIRTAPGFYLPPASPVVDALVSLGFTRKEQQNYHAIVVDDQDLITKMAPMEKRRLKKSAKEELSFRFARRDEFASVFAFIRLQREVRAQSLSLNWEDIKTAIRSNKESYRFAMVLRQDELVAASLLVSASDSVIYSFYPAHDAAYNSLSPMVFLLYSLYGWCMEKGFTHIDLGTSYLGSKVNQTLVNFKEHMGAASFASTNFRKALSS